MKTVSVIVATYRREKELANALVSIANQTYTDFEIVIVDDNAQKEWNEKVFGVVEQFKQHFPVMVVKLVVNKENQGSAQTRNIGIEASEGDYITFLDDDDIYLPAKIQKQLEFMKEQKCDFSITDLDLYYENGKLADKRVRNYIKDTATDELRKYHLMYHMTGTDVLMFTKAYLQKIGGFAPINVGDEYYLMLRAIDGAGKFGYLPGCDVKAYIHLGENSLSSGDGKIAGENALYQYKKTYFKRIDAKTRRYIRMRHYASLAFAEIRRNNFFSFVVNGVKSFISAPVECFKLVAKRKW